MALTPKQEKFCQCIVSGMSGKDSYLAAYDTKASDAVLYNEANKLLQRDDITKRLAELRKPLENHARNTAISEREKKRALIWERIQYCQSVNDDSGLARYMDILNKMDSEYININRNIEDNTKALQNIDSETLLKLTSGVIS